MIDRFHVFFSIFCGRQQFGTDSVLYDSEKRETPMLFFWPMQTAVLDPASVRSYTEHDNLYFILNRTIKKRTLTLLQTWYILNKRPVYGYKISKLKWGTYGSPASSSNAPGVF